MIALVFTEKEIEVIARLTGNLMASAFDAGLDPGVLEAIYYKTSQHLESNQNDFT